jgi:hypothetical protein
LRKGFIKGFEMKRTLVVSLKTEVKGEREREVGEEEIKEESFDFRERERETRLEFFMGKR